MYFLATFILISLRYHSGWPIDLIPGAIALILGDILVYITFPYSKYKNYICML